MTGITNLEMDGLLIKFEMYIVLDKELKFAHVRSLSHVTSDYMIISHSSMTMRRAFKYVGRSYPKIQHIVVIILCRLRETFIHLKHHCIQDCHVN